MTTPDYAKPWAVFALVSASVFLVSLDATVLFVAFQAMRKSFANVSPAELSWVLNAYTIIYAALLVPAGRLADLYGRKRLFQIGVALFTLGSACCGIAPTAAFLIAMRVLQAVGAALLTPASLALILAGFPKEKRPIVVSLWGAVGALAAAAGPSVGALIIETWGWQWAFFINFPIGVVSLLKGTRMLSESRSAENAALPDIIGIVLLVAGVGALALAIVQSGSWGWTGQNTIAAIAAGTAALIAFFAWASRVQAPALDVSLFRDANYLFANVATLVFGIAFTTMFFSFFFFMTQVWDYSLLKAGFAITPGPLLVIPVAIASGRYAARHGHRPALVTGGLAYALGGTWFYFMADATPNYLGTWLPGMLLTGTGVGLILPSLAAAAVHGLPANRFGVGSAANQAIRQMGSVLGVALVIAVVGESAAPLPSFRILYATLMLGGMLTSLLSMRIRTTPAIAPAPQMQRPLSEMGSP